MSSGRGRPSGVNWHSSAVTRRPPGSWEPGRCLAFAEGRRKLHRARSLIRPRSRLLCALTCKFGQVPPCWKPCQWFQGEGTAVKLRKHLVCLRQLDLGEKMPIPFPLAQGFWTVLFQEAGGMLLPHPDQSSCLLNISEGDDGV